MKRAATICGSVSIVLALIVSRRPDALTNPQFWAEDGRLWFAAAHNRGPLVALLEPAAGYFQTFSRLTAAAGVAVGLRAAPLVFNVAAIVGQALPPLYLLSSRLAGAIPDWRLRALAALILIGLPNSFEVQSNVTNVQTHLAILGFLIVVADAPRRRAWAACDLLLLIVGGLSGPTYVFLVPVAIAVWWRERSTWRLVVLATVAATAVVQTVAFLTADGGGRFATPLEPTVRRFFGIVGGHIVVGGLAGAPVHGRLFLGQGDPGPLLPALGVVCVLAVARAFVVTSSFALRLLIVFGVLVLGAALTSPAVDAAPRWQALQWRDVGIRYWVIPTVAFLAVVLRSACADPWRGARWVARVALAVLVLVGMPLDWRVKARPDLRFADQVERYEDAPPGSVVRIPIPPAGWEMRLRKR